MVRRAVPRPRVLVFKCCGFPHRSLPFLPASASLIYPPISLFFPSPLLRALSIHPLFPPICASVSKSRCHFGDLCSVFVRSFVRASAPILCRWKPERRRSAGGKSAEGREAPRLSARALKINGSNRSAGNQGLLRVTDSESTQFRGGVTASVSDRVRKLDHLRCANVFANCGASPHLQRL